MLKEFLKAYFLRPENAFMTYRRAYEFHKVTEKAKSKNFKMIDISCADGIFSFITAGGELNDSYDLFVNVSDKLIDNLKFDKNTDIFNSNTKLFSQNIIKKVADYKINYGTDWKNSLLEKAKSLDLYENLLEHDNNNPFTFSGETFDIVYSNSIYWVTNINQHIESLFKITKKGGILVLQLKTNDILKYHPSNLNLNFLSKESLNILDRGRLESWKSIESIDWWLNKLESKGFKLVEKRLNYSKEQMILWHIGLRPIAHFFIKAFNKLDMKERTEIKMEMVNYMLPLIEDISRIEPKDNDTYEYTLVFER